MTSRPKPAAGGDQSGSGREKYKLFQRKSYGQNMAMQDFHGNKPEHEGARDIEQGQNGDRYNHNAHKVEKHIEPDGESGRKWIHPIKMFAIMGRSSSKVSMMTNVLWPFTVAAMVLHWGFPEKELWIFITAYIGMIPAANLVGFAGQELARKIPMVIGVVMETTLGSIVEIVLFMVLIKGDKAGENIHIIQAAILGSILANLLLCLGLCFFVGGLFHPEQTFHEAISEVGSNLMLVAGFGLVIPTIYYQSLQGNPEFAGQDFNKGALEISRAAAIVLLVAFLVYCFFQIRSHHGLYEDILKADEHRDVDRHRDLVKPKLTFTEAVIAVLVGIMFVSLMAIFLVQNIEFIVTHHGVSDSFMGLILIPVVEKAAEHLTAMDEAYDNQMNFALSHVLGASIQTALLNTPLVVIVGWGLGKDMSLKFELFDAVVLILAIMVVGNFLRDEKSDYLEGALSVFVYVLIAVSAFYYPSPPQLAGGTEGGGEAAHRLLKFT
nr:hypothetical protein B0A51_13599 [Rachicladosporium sp. CCFEE 5018]